MESGYYIQNSEASLNFNEHVGPSLDDKDNLLTEEDVKEQEQEIEYNLMHEFNDLIGDAAEDCNLSFSSKNDEEKYLSTRHDLWHTENLWLENIESPCPSMENGEHEIENLSQDQQNGYSESNETTPHLRSEQIQSAMSSSDYHFPERGSTPVSDCTPCSNNSYEDQNIEISDCIGDFPLGAMNGEMQTNPEFVTGGLNPNAVPFSSYTDSGNRLALNFAANGTERSPNEWLDGEFYEREAGKLQYQFINADGNSSEVVQLRILYDARGRELNCLRNELEQEKDSHKINLENVEDQLESLKGENEALAARLGEFADYKDLVTEKDGKIAALNSRISSQETNKLELTKQLQLAESTIESLHDQIGELERIDAISRSRTQHDMIVSNMQKKHEEESQKMRENMDALCAQLQSKTEEVSTLHQKLTDMAQNLVNSSEAINQLTKSLEDSQAHCQNLLKGGPSMNDQDDVHGSSQTSKKIIASLQDEIMTLKDELEMYESVNNVQDSVNDTMNLLNVRKQFSWKTAETPSNVSAVSNDLPVVTNLKHELERSLSSNRSKRSKLTKLQLDYRNNLREIELVKNQLSCAEKQIVGQQAKITTLQAKLSDLNPMGKEQSVINIHEMDKLRIEKEQLVEDLDEAKLRLNESIVNERQLDQAVRQLHQQMSQLVHENSEDRRRALERAQQTYLQLHEESIRKVRKEMTIKHKDEMTLMQDKLKEYQDEMDSLKQIYVNVCQEKTQIEKALDESKTKLDESEKRMAEMTESWKEKMKEMQLGFDLKIEEAVHHAQSKKSLQWQQNMDAVHAEKEKETIHKIMDMSHRLEMEKDEALVKLEEKKNKEFLREMKKVNEKAARESQEALKALKQKMNSEKEKLIELLENGWKQNKTFELKELEEKHQNELEQLTDKLMQEKFIELKQCDEKRDKERKKLVQHIVLKKNKEKHEQLKQLEERMEKQFQEKLNHISTSKTEELERIEKEKNGEINDLRLKIHQLEVEYEEGARAAHDKAKHDKEMLITLMEDARRKELKELHEKDKTEATNQLKVKEVQEQMKLLVEEREAEQKNALAEMERMNEENGKLKDDLNTLQTKFEAKNKELDDVKMKLLDRKKEVRGAFRLLEQKKNKEKDDALKSIKENSVDGQEQRINLDCLKSLQEQNNELLKLYKNGKQEFEREKAEIQLNHNKAVTLLKEKHLHVVKALRKEQKAHLISEPVEADAQHVIALKSQVSKLDAELKIHQAKVRELETQMKIKNGQLETLQQEQSVEMKHVEIQMHLMLQDMQTKLEEKQIEIEKVKNEHDKEMSQFQRKLIENANQDADVEKKMKEIVAQMKMNEESLGEKVHELELGLDHKKTQVQLITLKANQEIEKLKNELEKANREKDSMKLSPQFGLRHVTDKSQQEKAQLKAKLRQCQKFAQNREVQHQMAIVKLQQEHTDVVKDLESKMEALKKSSVELSLKEVTKLHRAQVKMLKEQYSAELTAVHQQYARELESVQGFVQHYQAMYKQLQVDSDPDNMIEIQDSIKQVVNALQKDLFQYLNGLNKRVAQRIHTEVMKERKMIVARLKEQFGIKETKDLELSILHSEMEAQLHVEPTVDTWATVSHSEGFLSANAECDRIASCFELKGDTIKQEDHLTKLLKQMGLHSSCNETPKGQKLEASCLRYKTPLVDKFGHEIIPLRSAFSVDHITNSNTRKDEAERKAAAYSSSDKKLYDIRTAVIPATREQPIGQSASETIVFKSNKQSGKKSSPRSNRTNVVSPLDSVQTLGKQQGDDLKESTDQVPQTESKKCNINKGIQRVLETHPAVVNALLETFQNHLQDKNYINKMCQSRTVNDNQLNVGDNCASKTFVPLETESDSSVSVGGWTTGVNDTDKGRHGKGKRQWVRKTTAASVDK